MAREIVRSYKYAADALEDLEKGATAEAQVLATLALVGAIGELTEVIRRESHDLQRQIGMLR